MQTDPVFVEILRNRFKAIAEEMATVTLRTAFTVFVKETGDFGSCLVAPNGETFAAPTTISVSHMVGRPTWVSINALSKYEEGDIGISNDPELTRGLSTHLPDIWLWKPIFYEGQIIAYAISFIHSSDVGGRVPGSVSPTCTEIYQEGLRIPPAKLFRKGELNQELLDLILLNCRIPEQNWGDIKAQVISLNTAERRIHEMIARYGVDAIVNGIDNLMDHGEQRARTLISQIPDGEYQFIEYVEGDVAGGRPIRIKLTLKVNGSDALLDFTGTDLQVQAALNMPTWNQKGHYAVSIAMLNYFRTVDPEIPYNSGVVRPIDVHIPPGTLLNPDPHMAVGVRAATMLRVVDTLTACLGQALPSIFPAASSGAASIVLVSTIDVQSGSRRVSVAQPLLGGSGARPAIDGIDGTSFTGGWLRNIPNEVLETDMPILIEKYGFREHSTVPGKFRGGAAIHFRFKTFAPDTIITARGLERFTFRPWGLRGGKPGLLGKATLNPGTPDERDLGKLDLLKMNPGDIVDFQTASGGAFGDPFARDPAKVLEDVENGMVTLEAACQDYGVMIVDGRVDEEATGRLRAGQSLVDFDGIYDVGPERRAYEDVWPEELQSALIEVISRYPSALRPYLRGKAIADIEQRQARGEPVGLLDIARMVEDVLAMLNTGMLQMVSAPAAE